MPPAGMPMPPHGMSMNMPPAGMPMPPHGMSMNMPPMMPAPGVVVHPPRVKMIITTYSPGYVPDNLKHLVEETAASAEPEQQTEAEQVDQTEDEAEKVDQT